MAHRLVEFEQSIHIVVVGSLHNRVKELTVELASGLVLDGNSHNSDQSLKDGQTFAPMVSMSTSKIPYWAHGTLRLLVCSASWLMVLRCWGIVMLLCDILRLGIMLCSIWICVSRLMWVLI